MKDKEWIMWLQKYAATEVLDEDDDEYSFEAYLVPKEDVKLLKKALREI